jgi:pyridoxine/pyridoxamine 5'-phosphate oxidase
MGWLEVFTAQQARNRPGNRMQVATVGLDGAPQLRTVVLRGFTREGAPWFFTDARSGKVAELLRHRPVSLLLWWERTADQFRLDGLASVHGPSAAGEPEVLRRAAWQRLPVEQRALFLGPAPGALLAAPAAPHAASTATAPDDFVLVTVEVHRVDWLRLGSTHTRLRFTREGEGWKREELVP